MNMNPWARIAQAQPVEGALLECKIGKWLLEGQEIASGPNGLQMVALLPSATVGEIKFEQRQKTDERTGRVEDGFVPAERLDREWSPSTAFLTVGFDDNNRGQMMTFRSTSWGGRFAFNGLATMYWRLGQNAFPIVYLDVAKKWRNDREVLDPVFRVIGWRPREDFAELGFGVVPLALEGPSAAPAEAKPAADPEPAAALVDDDIPF